MLFKKIGVEVRSYFSPHHAVKRYVGYAILLPIAVRIKLLIRVKQNPSPLQPNSVNKVKHPKNGMISNILKAQSHVLIFNTSKMFQVRNPSRVKDGI